MLQKEIEVGGEYLTRVSGALVRVRVLHAVERESWSARQQTLTRFKVARVDNGETLPKVRTASALHRPAYDRDEIDLIRAVKSAPGYQKGDASNALIAFRFINAVNLGS